VAVQNSYVSNDGSVNCTNGFDACLYDPRPLSDQHNELIGPDSPQVTAAEAARHATGGTVSAVGAPAGPACPRRSPPPSPTWPATRPASCMARSCPSTAAGSPSDLP